MIFKVDPTLLAAYAATDYVVNGVEPAFVLRVGQPSTPLRTLHEQYGISCSAFLTAWNPGSSIRANELNQSAQSELETTLRARGFTLIPGVGVDPDGNWPAEQSVLVLGVAREEAEQLGREYGQNAILWMGADAVPEVLLLI
jgi:hypothetical protein